MNDTLVGLDIAEVAAQVARCLAKSDVLDGRAFIRTPVLFPSGATVVVVLEVEGGGRYRLSDLGQGRDEAELLGIAGSYARQAQLVARLSGLTLENGAFVLAGAEAVELVAGTMAVANAAGRALERTLSRARERADEISVERLVSRLGAVFPNAEIGRDEEVRGQSTHAWPVAAVLRTDAHWAVFDVVKPNAASVVWATAKFHDFARLERAPARVAVVHRKDALGDLLSVVSQAARVIEDSAPDSAFVRAARAA
jgi:hypothetical protein